MANASITDLRNKYINNFRNKITTSTALSTLYHKTNATEYMAVEKLKTKPDGYDNFPIIGNAADVTVGGTISISKFSSIVQATAGFFGCVRKFRYGLTGNDGNWTDYAVGYIGTGTWRLNATEFPDYAGVVSANNDAVIKARIITEAAKFTGKQLQLTDVTTFFDNMAAIVQRTAVSYVSMNTDYPDLRVCHGSCHSSCHSSCHTSCHTSCHSSEPAPTQTATMTSTPQPTQTATQTSTPQPTQTATQTSTPAPTQTATQTSTPAPTQTSTPAPTQTQTPAPTQPPNPFTGVNVSGISLTAYFPREGIGGTIRWTMSSGGSWSSSRESLSDWLFLPSSSGRWMASGISSSDIEVYVSGVSDALISGITQNTWTSMSSFTISLWSLIQSVNASISVRRKSIPSQSMSFSVQLSAESV